MAKVKKAFCLEMIENLLEQYPSIFRQMNQFTFLLKEKVCNIVIKLFSPGCKYQDTTTSGKSFFKSIFFTEFEINSS